MLVINTGKRFRDLPLNVELLEHDCSPIDIMDKLNNIICLDYINDSKIVYNIFTLNMCVFEHIGNIIEAGKISSDKIKINIYKNHNVDKTASFDCKGYLNDDWEIGLLELP